MNTCIARVATLLIIVTACASVCFGQSDTKNLGGFSPPAELKRFEPFLGRYEAAVDWPSRNLKWNGSLEFAGVIKGWYIELNLIKETAGPHRHWRLMIAWDGHQKKYRVWNFGTSGPHPELEGVIKFEGDNEWYAEWHNFPQPDGKRVTHSSRFRLKNKDELDIITETLDADGKRERLGVVTCKRKM